MFCKVDDEPKRVSKTSKTPQGRLTDQRTRQTVIRVNSRAHHISLKWTLNIVIIGFNYNPLIDYKTDIGSVNIVCPHCKAINWKSEYILYSSESVRSDPILSRLLNFINNFLIYKVLYQRNF